MSAIDQRIVQMRFDNKDFESNVGTTMSTLEKLKEKLKFTKSDEGIQNLKGAFNNFNISGIANGVDSINDKFSALGIAGMEVIRRITNAAIDMGEKIAKSFTLDPIMDGFAEYELKMGSVQTILMGAHTREGLPVTLEMVNKELDELNQYADKTIYSFSDMTSNIGKFTNAGVSLEDSVAAIQGISNVAALSGANAQQASHAMYNFAQALSSGAVKLIDWKSIENANMATVEFKETLIDTALKVGTLVEEEGEYISTTTDANGHVSDAFTATSKFNDSLSAQWMTTEVLTEALARYSDENDELGKKAFEAATQVKTWSQLKDTVKEALGSGWAQTWEYIIGDFNEAKEMWTGLNNIISGVINPIADARNEMFKFWHDNGGRDAMIDAFAALWENIKGVTTEIKSIGGNVFAENFGTVDWGQALVKATEAVRDFFRNLQPSNELKSAFSSVVETFFRVIETGAAGVARAARFFSAFWNAIEPGRKILYGIVEALSDTVAIIAGIITRIGNAFEATGGLQALANGFANLFNKILELAAPAAAKIHAFFVEIAQSDFTRKTGEVLTAIAKKFEELTAAIDVQAIIAVVSSAFEKFTGILSTIWGYISPVVTGIGSFLSSLLDLGGGADTVGEKIENAKAKIGELKDPLIDLKERVVQWFLEHAPADLIDDVSTAVDKLNGFLQPLKERASAIKDSFSDGTWYSKLKEWIGGVVDKIGELKDTIHDFIGDKVVQAFTSLWEGIADAFRGFVDLVKSGWDFIKKVFHSLFGDDLYTAVNRIFEFMQKFAGVKALFTFTDILDSVSNLAEGLDKLKTNLEKASINLTKSLLAPLKSFASKTRSEGIRNIAISIAILTASLIALSFVEFEKIQNGVIAVGELLALLIGFFAAMEVLSKKLSGGGTQRGGLLGMVLGSQTSASSLKSNSVGFVALAASILMMSFALAKLAGIPFLDIQKGILAIAELMVGLILFSKYTNGLKIGAIDVTALSIAIDLLSLAISKLGGLSFDDLMKGLGGLAIVMIELVMFMREMEGVSTKGFTGIIALAAGLRVMVSSVKGLASLDLDGLVAGLGGLAIMFLELGLFLTAMENVDTKGFAGVIVLAAGLRLMVTSVRALSDLDVDALLLGLGGVAILLIELAMFMNSMNGVAGVSIAAAAALIVMATALKLLSGVVITLGETDAVSLVKGLTAVAAVLAIFVAACKLLDDTSAKILVASAAMIVMAAAVTLMILPIKALGALPFADVVQGIGAIAAVFVIFGVAGKVLGQLSLDMVKAGAAMLVMAAAIWVLVPPIVALGAMPFSNIMQAILGLAAVFVVFGAAGAILGPLAGNMILAAVGILALSAAAAAAGASLILIGVGLSALGNGLMTIMDVILAILQSVLSGLPFIGDDIDDWFTERRAALKDNLDPEESKATAEDWTKGVGDGIMAAKGDVTDATDDVTASINDALKQTNVQAEESGEGFGTSFFEGYSMTDLTGFMTGDMSNMSGMVEGLMSEGGMNSGNAFGEGFASSDMLPMIESVMGNTTSAYDTTYEAYMSGQMNGKELLDGMSDGVFDGLPGFYKVTSEGFEKVSQENLNDMVRNGEITGEQYDRAIADSFQSGYGVILDRSQSMFDNLGRDVDSGRSANLLGDDFTNELSNYGIDVESVMGDWGASAGEGLEDASKYFSQGGETDMDAFLSSMMDEAMGNGGAYDTAEDIADEAVDGLENAEDGGYRTGQNFGYSFGDGTLSTSRYVESAAATLARRALTAMETELDINSPSKEAAKLGKFGGMGLGVGFKDSTAYVKKQASSLAGTGLTAMQSAMEKLHEALNFGKDFDPTIRPVLDLQQIQNGMSTIGSMFGSQQFALAGAFGIDSYAFRGIRNVTSAADSAPRGDQSVVNALGALQDEVSTLKGAMESMKFEADGKEIGHVAYREVDRLLGNTVARNRREGRG